MLRPLRKLFFPAKSQSRKDKIFDFQLFVSLHLCEGVTFMLCGVNSIFENP